MNRFQSARSLANEQHLPSRLSQNTSILRGAVNWEIVVLQHSNFLQFQHIQLLSINIGSWRQHLLGQFVFAYHEVFIQPLVSIQFARI